MSQPVEYIDLGGGTTTVIGGVQVHGAETVERTGGTQLPEHSAEEQYDYRSRVGPVPTEVTVEGWVTSEGYSSLVALENSPEPFPAAGPNFTGTTWGLQDISDTMESGTPGAHQITIDLIEIQQASTGTTTIRSVEPDRTEEPASGEGDAGGQPSWVSTE